MKTTKRILSLLLCMVMILGIIPVFASAAGETYTKITSAAELTSGQYVLIVNSGGKALQKYDSASSGWVLAATPTVDGDQVTDAAGAVWTLTVTGDKVTLKDANGKFIKPKSGNNNGIQNGEYSWTWAMATDGTVTFNGTGSDTTTLALNKNEGKFRSYKKKTVSGNAAGYPNKFTLYKLDEAVDPDVPVCEHTNLDDAIHVDGQHVADCLDCQEVVVSKDYVVSVEFNETEHYEVCTCGFTGIAKAHEMSDWTVKTPATAAAPGEEIKTCSGCAYTLSQEIPQLEATGNHYIKYANETLLSGTYILVTNNFGLGAYENNWVLNTVPPVLDDNTVTDDMGGVWTLTVTDNGVMLTDANGVTVAPKGGNNNGIIEGDYNWAWTYDAETGTYTFAGVSTDTVVLALNTDATNGLNRFRGYKTSTLESDTKNTYYTNFTLYKLEGEQSCAHDIKYTTTETTHISSCTICGEVFVEESYHDIKGENGTCSICGYEVDAQVLAYALIDALYALEAGGTIEGSFSLTGKVIEINYTFDANYKNMSVTIEVAGKEDKPIYCYRMKCTAEQAAQIAVGRVITVEGSFEHFVKEDVHNYEIKGSLIAIAECEHVAAEAVKENEVAANCTTAGSYDSVVYCSICNAEMSRETMPVEALGHTAAEAVKENEVAANCTTAGSYDSVVYCSVCNAEMSRETMPVEALGHNYVDGTCSVCGATSVLTDSNLVFYGVPGLSFQDYIGIQVSFLTSKAKKYDTVYVEITQITPEGPVTTVSEGAPFPGFEGVITLFEQQIVSWSMTERVTMTLYGEKNGVKYQGASFTTSVEELALEKAAGYAGNDEARCRTMVDVLNYGAAVQVAFDHNAANLPNTKLGDLAQYGTQTQPEMTAENVISGSGAAKVLSDNISLQDKVEFNFLVKDTTLATYTPKAMLNGEEIALNYTDLGGGYIAVRAAISAANMRSTYTFALYDADGNVASKVYNVSAEAYAKSLLTGTTGAAYVAMMQYGDSVASIV